MIGQTPAGPSISRQCGMLAVSRSSYYYEPRPVSAEDLELMRLMDEQFMKTPTHGSRSMCGFLRRQGHIVNRKRVQRLMRVMGIEAVRPGPRTSVPHPEHKVFPYLLRDLKVVRPNQVWAADITYIPMRRGFMYLAAVMDWHTRKVLAWRVSNTMDADFCVEAAEEAIARYGPPEVFNTDQGSQYTSAAHVNLLKSHGISISMDGRGRCIDNVFVERLWWTVKYHYLYLREFESGSRLRKGLSEWFAYYNEERGHQSLDGCTPDEVYFGTCAAAA